MQQIDDFDDDDQAPDPVRAQLRKVEADNKTLRDQVAQAAELQRKVAFLEAGINPADPMLSYFYKGYDGELTAEAIKTTAAQAGFVAAVLTDASPEDQAAFGRMSDAAAGTSSGRVDYAELIAKAKSPDEVKELLAQARAAGQ